MAFLTKDDLTTHLYAEITDVITRSNDAIITKAINASMAEIMSYLNRFDLTAMFGSSTSDPTYQNEHLKTLAKDVCCWHIIKLANPNINLELFRTVYADAIKFLEKVMKGTVDPGWPLRTDTIDTGNTKAAPSLGGENINPGVDLSGHIDWNSNRKRTNHW